MTHFLIEGQMDMPRVWLSMILNYSLATDYRNHSVSLLRPTLVLFVSTARNSSILNLHHHRPRMSVDSIIRRELEVWILKLEFIAVHKCGHND